MCATVGLILQIGVVAIHAALTYVMRKGKGDGKVIGYSFPVTALGTLLLCLGMYICASVVDGSTVETTRALQTANGPLQIVWIQRGGQIVSDQQFHSYAIYAPRGRNIIYSSYPTVERSRLEFWTLVGVVVTLPGQPIYPSFVGTRIVEY